MAGADDASSHRWDLGQLVVEQVHDEVRLCLLGVWAKPLTEQEARRLGVALLLAHHEAKDSKGRL